jgi:hypothetical protein
METNPMKPNPETPNRKLARLAREIIQRFVAQGKEFTVDDVARELYRNVFLDADKRNRGDLLAALAREGTYQFAWDEWQNWRDRQEHGRKSA